ncbi:g3994 [Coccomyxa elongata]
MDPQSSGLGRQPAHEYVVKEASIRRQMVLDRKAAVDGHAAKPIRPPIRADSTDDQRSGDLRAIEPRWASRAARLGSSTGLGHHPALAPTQRCVAAAAAGSGQPASAAGAGAPAAVSLGMAT